MKIKEGNLFYFFFIGKKIAQTFGTKLRQCHLFLPHNHNKRRLTHNHKNSWGQFHQNFTSSFCAYRSQKRKKDSQVVNVFFALSGSERTKGASCS